MSRIFLEALKNGIFAPGVYDSMGAKLAQKAGHEVIYSGNYSYSCAQLGLADMQFVDLNQLLNFMRWINSGLAQDKSKPAVAVFDIEEGFGDIPKVQQTVEHCALYGQAKVMHMEDQRQPKRCGHLGTKQVIDAHEWAAKYKAGLDVANELGVVLIHRTDAATAHKRRLDEAIDRTKRAIDMGAPVCWVEFSSAKRSVAEQVATVIQDYAPGHPLAINYSPNLEWHRLKEDHGETPLTREELWDMGYKFIFSTLYQLKLVAGVIYDGMVHFKENGHQAVVDELDALRNHPCENAHELGNYSNIQNQVRKYMPEIDKQYEHVEGYKGK